MASWLSLKIIVAVGSLLSLISREKRNYNQIVSLMAWICAIYSALQKDKDMVDWFFQDQLITQLLIFNRNLEFKQQVSRSFT